MYRRHRHKYGITCHWPALSTAPTHPGAPHASKSRKVSAVDANDAASHILLFSVVSSRCPIKGPRATPIKPCSSKMAPADPADIPRPPSKSGVVQYIKASAPRPTMRYQIDARGGKGVQWGGGEGKVMQYIA